MLVYVAAIWVLGWLVAQIDMSGSPWLKQVFFIILAVLVIFVVVALGPGSEGPLLRRW